MALPRKKKHAVKQKAPVVVEVPFTVLPPKQDSLRVGLRPGRRRQTFVVDESDLGDLKVLAWVRETTVSQLVNAAIAAYLESQAQDLKAAKGLQAKRKAIP